MDGSIFIFIALMGLLLWLLLIRPQRQQARRHQEMLSSLKVGDEVVTAGGIYGEVTAIDDDRVQLEIDADVKVAVARRAISSVVPPEEAAELTERDEPGLEADEAEPVAEEKART